MTFVIQITPEVTLTEKKGEVTLSSIFPFDLSAMCPGHIHRFHILKSSIRLSFVSKHTLNAEGPFQYRSLTIYRDTSQSI